MLLTMGGCNRLTLALVFLHHFRKLFKLSKEAALKVAVAWRVVIVGGSIFG